VLGFAAIFALGADACLSTAGQPLLERPEAAAPVLARARAGERLVVEEAAAGWFRVRSADGRRRGHVPADACLLSVHGRHAPTDETTFADDVHFAFDGDRRPDTLWIALAGTRPTLVLTTAAGRSWFLDPALADGLGERNGMEIQSVAAREVVGGAPKEVVVTGGFPVEGGSRSSQTVYRVVGDRLEPVFAAQTSAVYMYAGYETCAALRFRKGAIEVRSLVFEGEDVPEFIDQRLSARTDRYAWDEKARRFGPDPVSTERGPVAARTRRAVALRAAPDADAAVAARLPAGAPVEVRRWRTTDSLESATWDGRAGMPLEVRAAGATGWLLTADVKPGDPTLCPDFFAP
jgi:hypothetical protein